MVPIPYPLINQPIAPANKTYAAVKSAVDAFAWEPKYIAVVAALGGAASLATKLLNIVTSKALITVGEAASKSNHALQVLTSQQLALTSFITKVMLKLSNVSMAVIKNFP